MDKISEFRGQYRFLSNFYLSPISYEGLGFKTVEHAYQAAKTIDTKKKLVIANCITASKAKTKGKMLNLRPDWLTVRLPIMEELVGLKFNIPELRAMLLATGRAELVEGNWWGDVFWGVCRGTGENHLGKILMKIREEKRNA